MMACQCLLTSYSHSVYINNGNYQINRVNQQLISMIVKVMEFCIWLSEMLELVHLYTLEEKNIAIATLILLL